MRNNVCSWQGVGDRRRCVGELCYIGGNRGINRMSRLNTLTLSSQVTHLSLLQFRKILGNIFYIDERPSAVVALSNGFEPCCFEGKTCGSMQVADGGRKAW